MIVFTWILFSRKISFSNWWSKNILNKIILDKQDILKEGRDILCSPNFPKNGIAHEIYDEENRIIMIFVIESVPDEPKF